MLTVLQDAWPFPEASAHESRANMKAPSTARKDTLGQVAAVLFVFTVLFAAPALAESPVGVCGRTPQVRDALLAGVQANNATVADCSQVTTAHLQALNGTMDLSNRGITSLKSGDLTDLTNLVTVFLSGNALTGLPDGIFASMTNLQELYLYDNDFQTLSDGVFEGLANLVYLYLENNPGTDSFQPTADAGVDQKAASGTTVRLDGSASRGGPWGTNITYDWAVADAQGNPVTDLTLTGGDTATPSFVVPETVPDGGFVFTLTVQGKGHRALARILHKKDGKAPVIRYNSVT